IGVSLFGKRKEYDFDKLLHRGKYAVAGETQVVDAAPARGWKILGMGKEFTRGDKIIYVVSYIWTGAWLVAFIIGTIYNLTHEVADASWLTFWRVYLTIHIVVSVAIIVWFLIGGFRDLMHMNRRLETSDRDHRDDGFVTAETSAE
ncbi:sodium:solute symporter, partial [candidate division GN15 bacterium]